MNIAPYEEHPRNAQYSEQKYKNLTNGNIRCVMVLYSEMWAQDVLQLYLGGGESRTSTDIIRLDNTNDSLLNDILDMKAETIK